METQIATGLGGEMFLGRIILGQIVSGNVGRNAALFCTLRSIPFEEQSLLNGSPIKGAPQRQLVGVECSSGKAT